MKICTACGLEKDHSEYQAAKSTKDGLNWQCRDCTRVYQREWREAHPNYQQSWRLANRDRLRKPDLYRKYGMSIADFNAMGDAQGGRCAICTRKAEKLVVDHCHLTGCVRALLCGTCNSGLGMFEDNQWFLKAATEYLVKHQSGVMVK